MKKVLKIVGFVLGGLVALILVFVGVAFISSNSRINRTYDIPTDGIVAATDTASLENGEHLATVFCADCHGEDFGGKPFFEDPVLAVFPASNLTAGEGGVGTIYSDDDYERAIRHGVGADGKGLWIMPANEYNHFSDEDIAAIIGYLRSQAAVDNDPGPASAGPVGRILVTLGALELIPAENIDHNFTPVAAVEPAVDLEYGEYLAITCTGCHAPDYAGGPSPEPGAPTVANLTPHAATGLGSWTEENFFTAMRSGVRPDGSELSPAMPWQSYVPLTDDELSAIWLFLQSVPPVDTSAE